MKNIYSLADEGLPFARTSRLRHFGRNNVLFQSKEIVWRKVPLELWIIAVSLYYFLSLCTWLKIYIKIYFFSQWLIEKYTRIQIDLVKLPAGFRPYIRVYTWFIYFYSDKLITLKYFLVAGTRGWKDCRRNRGFTWREDGIAAGEKSRELAR